MNPNVSVSQSLNRKTFPDMTDVERNKPQAPRFSLFYYYLLVLQLMSSKSDSIVIYKRRISLHSPWANN